MRMLAICEYSTSSTWATVNVEEVNKANELLRDMLTPSHDQFHPTMLTVMGQVNQALTGYGAISVYGPQIFELLGYGVSPKTCTFEDCLVLTMNHRLVCQNI